MHTCDDCIVGANYLASHSVKLQPGWHYNADEFGLFYQALPEKLLHLKSEKCVGRNHSKIRLTGMAAANSLGKKLPTFVIRKLAKPWCFSGVRNIPCRYRARKIAGWIVSLFEDWIRELDSKFEREGRKIVLIVDNFPAHSHVKDLKAIDLVFLPLSTIKSCTNVHNWNW